MNTQDCLKDPRLFVRYWFSDKGLKIAGNLILTKSGDDFTISQVFNSMWLDYIEQLRELNANRAENTFILKGFPEKDLDKALGEYLEIKRREAAYQLKETLRFNGHNLIAISNKKIKNRP